MKALNNEMINPLVLSINQKRIFVQQVLNVITGMILLFSC